MNKLDVQCPACRAAYLRLELVSLKGQPGPFHCKVCQHLLEVSDGVHDVVYRLTVLPGNLADLIDREP
jgi:hypothetical protein